MSWAIHHFISGAAFFSGSLLLIAAVVTSAFGKGKAAAIAVRLSVFLGVLFIVLSATPMPLWQYGIWLVGVVGCIVSEVVWRARRKLVVRMARRALALLTLLAVARELPHRVMPAPVPHATRSHDKPTAASVSEIVRP